MFLKKEKPKFEVRPQYSIREELELIREFCWQPKLEAGKIYTEEEIDVVEKRLNFKLPQPLRELYLVLGDYMCDKKDTWFCRPEELHWNGKYLLVTAMERTNRGWGIYGKDPYLSVYNWQRSGVNSYGEEKDEKPKSEVVRKSAYNQYFSKACFYWDIFIIQHVLDKVLQDWWDLHQSRMTEEMSPFYIGCSLPKKLDDKKYTARSFEESITRQCLKSGILDGEYVFKGNGYQKELCKALYRNGASIQAIREYMGYSTDETVKKYIGWVDEKVAEKSDEFFKQEENSLGGRLLMAKYDKMKEANRQESEKKMQLAVAEIRKTASEGNKEADG